jgi:hypothetical protein
MNTFQDKAEFYFILKFKCSAHLAEQFKEGIVWHADPSLGKDCETSNYTTAIAK